ncbi:SIR2 family protein [Natroniella sulfidigena]|uniref:SIR2 family protein n=1 Tax=Natroniella sulfidigena TaxID=723921 RepID=UPI00200B7EF6|nr:SIR2 family protein [Natroniella sulfidigena]MCK8816433.1 SIR2 family protein [Natroniella sulfidigena]
MSDITTASNFLTAILSSSIKYKEMASSIKSDVEEKITTEESIKDLIKSFKNDDLVFVLGAGVSIDSGLPNWEVLLQNLLLSNLEIGMNNSSENDFLLAEIFTKIFPKSLTISARYLQNNYSNSEDPLAFEKEIRKVLYKKANQNNLKSKLVDEIIQFCVAPGKSSNLDSIITYNYDDVIEKAISNLEIDLPYKSIYSPGVNPSFNELPIYHVHGFLPENEELTAKNKVVLSDSHYHEQYKNIYSWENIVQINKFKENTCLFIGVSFTDPNMRRLLDIANLQRGNNNEYHYLIKRRFDHEELKLDVVEALKKEADLSFEENEQNDFKEQEIDQLVSNLASMMEDFQEEDLLSFGIRTIWVDNYEEIPGVLKEIRTG